MKEIYFFLFSLCLCTSVSAQNKYAASTTGTWATAANWSAGHVPLAGEAVEIQSGSVVTVGANTNVVGLLTIDPGGALTVGNFTVGCAGLTINGTMQNNQTAAAAVAVTGDLNIGSAGQLISTATATKAMTVSVSGNLINGGILDESPGAAAGTVSIGLTGSLTINSGGTFTVGSSAALSCTGLTINGTMQNNQIANARTITVTGDLNIGSTGQLISKSTATKAMTVSVSGNLIDGGLLDESPGAAAGTVSIALTGALTINSGGTFTVGSTAALSCAGLTINGTMQNNQIATARTITVTGDLNIGSTGQLISKSTATKSMTVSVSGNLIDAGLVNESAGAAAGTVSITSTGALTISTGGTFTKGSGAALSCTGLTINGTLQNNEIASAKTLTVTGDLYISNTGQLISTSTATQAMIVAIGGNFTNGGIFNGSAYAGGGLINITFNGAAISNSFTNIGATTTIFNNIILNKSAINDTLNFAPTTALTLASGFLTLTKGIFEVGGTATISNTFLTTIGNTPSSNAGFWLNNPNANVIAVSGGRTFSGLIRITNGTFNTGFTGLDQFSNSTGSTTAAFLMEGGAFNATGGFIMQDKSSFIQTGGVITVGIVGASLGNHSFGLWGVTAGQNTINISGGTVVIQNPATSGGDYDISSATIPSITGGTLQLGNDFTPTGATFLLWGLVSPSVSVYNNASNSNPSSKLLGSLQIDGNLTLNGTGSFDLNGQILGISGNSAGNPGNLSANGATLLGSTGTLTMNGTFGPQTISSTTGTIQPGNLTISNSSGVTLTSPIAISNALTLNNGIVTNGSNVISVTNTATNAVGGTGFSTNGNTQSSYINGTLQWVQSSNAGDSYFYPIGNATKFNPVQITNDAVSGSNTFSAAYTNSPYSVLVSTNSIYAVSTTEYWNVTRVSGSTSDPVDLAISTSSAGASNIAGAITSGLLSAVQLGHFNSAISSWDAMGNNAGNTATFNSGNGATIVSTGLRSFSPYTFLSNQAILGIGMSDLAGSIRGSGIVLDWATATESNNKGFTVLRSIDGQNFDSIGYVNTQAPDGNSSSNLFYTFNDNSPSNNNNFYKLKQISLDGISDFSNVVRIDMKSANASIILSPNPMKAGSSAALILKGYPSGAKYRVYNSTGQLIKSGNLTSGSNQLSTQGFGEGIYNLIITDAVSNAITTRTFIVEL